MTMVSGLTSRNRSTRSFTRRAAGSMSTETSSTLIPSSMTRLTRGSRLMDPYFRTLYPDSEPLIAKIKRVVREIYGADDVIADTRLRQKLHWRGSNV